MADYKRIPDGVIKIPVPNVQQTTKFSCGAAVVQAVCCYFGVGPDDQDEYMEKLGTDPDGGTAPADIISFLKDHSLRAKAIKEMSLDDLKAYLESGRPVICAMQAYGTKRDYKRGLSGHYIVAIGYDRKHIYFEDPSAQGRRVFLPNAEFEERWHDYDKYGNQYTHLGIVVWKKGNFKYLHKAKKLD